MKRYLITLTLEDGKYYEHEFNDKTLARQKYAAILRTLDAGDNLTFDDGEENTTIMEYSA